MGRVALLGEHVPSDFGPWRVRGGSRPGGAHQLCRNGRYDTFPFGRRTEPVRFGTGVGAILGSSHTEPEEVRLEV